MAGVRGSRFLMPRSPNAGHANLIPGRGRPKGSKNGTGKDGSAQAIKAEKELWMFMVNLSKTAEYQQNLKARILAGQAAHMERKLLPELIQLMGTAQDPIVIRVEYVRADISPATAPTASWSTSRDA